MNIGRGDESDELGDELLGTRAHGAPLHVHDDLPRSCAPTSSPTSLAWTPKLAPGGAMAGKNYPDYPGVVAAVEQLAARLPCPVLHPAPGLWALRPDGKRG